MAYVPKTWETGEVIKATDLNHMENAIGAYYVTVSTVENSTVLSASYNDISSEISKGKLCVHIGELGVMYYLKQLNAGEGYYNASFGEIGGSDLLTFGSQSADENMVETIS